MSEREAERNRGGRLVGGVAVLAATGWQGVQTVCSVGPDGLLALCYLANLLLGAGMLCKSGLCVGVGFGWVLIAWPLWLVDTLVARHFSFSCAMFHTVGLIAGLCALREVRVPRGIAWVAIPTGLASFLLARWLTDPLLNINAAFHVQPGWNWAFPGLPESLGVQAVAYTLVFWYLPSLSRRVAALRNRP